MNVIDVLPTKMLKRTDLKNILNMLDDFIESENRYGRKDHWDMSIKRITDWTSFDGTRMHGVHWR